MVTGLLNRCGLHLGPSDQLMPSDPGNPLGYYENERFTYSINDALLSHFGAAWDHPPQLKEGWEIDPALDPIVHDAQTLIDSFSTSARWGWKDPRTTLLLPFWKSLIPHLQFVICVRSPLEVAKSLARRYEFPIHKGADLWDQYMRAAIRDTEDCPRLFTFYEDYFDHPAREINRLIEFCGLQKPDDPAIVRGAIASAFKHHSSEPSELLHDSQIPPTSKLLYIGLRALISDSRVGGASDSRREDVLSAQVSEFFKLFEQFQDQLSVAKLPTAVNRREGSMPFSG